MLTQVLNDDSKTLDSSFLQLTKLLISFCFFSPYLNFSNNKFSPKVNLIKKKFFLDYHIEKKSVVDMLKEKAFEETDSQRLFVFKRTIENSTHVFEASCQSIDNINFLIEQISAHEHFLKISSVKSRNRFLSEDPKQDFIEASVRMKARQLRSSLNFRFSETGKNQTQNERPFQLMDEVILKDNINEYNQEESLLLENPELLEMVMNSPQQTQSENFFEETTFSFKSKKEENRRKLFEEAHFENSSEVENVYFVLKEIKHIYQELRGRQDSHKSESE